MKRISRVIMITWNYSTFGVLSLNIKTVFYREIASIDFCVNVSMSVERKISCSWENIAFKVL